MTTKHTVLTQLANTSDYLSGETLAKQLHVSRNAIWKAVQALKKDGHFIDTHSVLGYKLIQSDYFLNQTLLQTQFDFPVYVYDTIDSTQTQAKKMADTLQTNALFISKHQTQGRGRFGRTFHSPKNTGIYMSLLYKAEYLENYLSLLTPLCAVAVWRGIYYLTGKKMAIKWVNDLFYHQKKIAGILTEALTNVETGHIEWLIIGMGINIYKDDQLPCELQKIVGYLSEEKIDMNALVKYIVTELVNLLHQLPNTNFLVDYRQHCFILEQTITILPTNDKPYIAKAITITERGELLIETPNGARRALSCGEISTRLGYPYEN